MSHHPFRFLSADDVKRALHETGYREDERGSRHRVDSDPRIDSEVQSQEASSQFFNSP